MTKSPFDAPLSPSTRWNFPPNLPPSTVKQKRFTPWGEAQTVREIAPGITHFTTASHGGVHLTAERHATVKAMFPAFTPFLGEGDGTGPGGGSWYEEDCDQTLIYVVFPQFFSAEFVKMATSIVEKDTAYYGQRKQ